MNYHDGVNGEVLSDHPINPPVDLGRCKVCMALVRPGDEVRVVSWLNLTNEVVLTSGQVFRVTRTVPRFIHTSHI